MINDPQIPTNTLETLKEHLVKLNEMKKELSFVKKNLLEKKQTINALIQEHGTTWSNHREKYNNELAKELEESHGITLTAEEKKMLDDSNSASITERRTKLEKLNIKIPDKATDFTIITYDAVVSALGRNLQDLNEAPGIVKKLSIISKEKNDANDIKSTFEKQYQEISTSSTELKNKAEKTTGLIEIQLNDIEQLAEAISTSKPVVPTLTPSEETQKLD